MVQHLNDLKNICETKISPEVLKEFGQDATEDLLFEPMAVLLPKSVVEVQAVMRYCNEHRIAVYTRGAGTGLCGAALPVNGGVVLSTKKLNQIISIDEKNFMATVEPGLINYHFREAVEALGLFYPPDPASYGSCSLGGNVAHSSGGPKCVKYGTTKDYVLNLEVVLPNGECIWTGANTVKNSTGFNLTQLMVGSEGLLGVVTKIVFKLIKKPKADILMLSGFKSATDACNTVNGIMMSGVVPSACELIQKEGLKLSAEAQHSAFVFEEGIKFYLLVELDGDSMDDLMMDAEKIFPIFEENKSSEVLFADTADQKEKWWKLRRSIGELVKQKSIYKEEDTVVPRFAMPQVFEVVDAVSEEYGFEAVCYGHAGDGNIHINILKNDLSDEYWNNEMPKGIMKIFEKCKELGGTISGEHGIGLVQKDYLPVVFNETHMNLMRGIKKSFDPNAILNPGKWL
ncbi:FAD-binding protein [Bacteroidia bacterium]|jgi:glycolate oxidase|nr:FAD-binding protein [Bacteroidia bacterium]